MTIQERSVDSVVALDLGGRLGLGDGDELLKETVDNLMTRGRKHVMLNLAGLSYVDSAGLGVLLSIFLEARKRGGSVRLHSPSKRLRDLLAMTRLLKELEVSDSESQALARFSAAV